MEGIVYSRCCKLSGRKKERKKGRREERRKEGKK
jgi:hypothetical protein